MHQIMYLCQALDLHRHDIVAAVGAGGKTTALQRLAAELAEQGACVVSTTTTSIWEPEGTLLVEANADALLSALSRTAAKGHLVTVAAGRKAEPGTRDGCLRSKLIGIHPDVVLRIARTAGVDYVLVEADGARGLSIKSPASHEPVIPPSATHVLAIAGIDALAQPLTGTVAHRPAQIAALLGITEGTLLDPSHIALLLADARAGRKGVPEGARFYPFINKVQDTSLRAARSIVGRVRAMPGITHVLIGAALSQQPVLERW
jgi:probable selenium-dependent hydroxylase accessory protein YqeC